MTTTDDLLHDAYLEGFDSVKELVAKIAQAAWQEGHRMGFAQGTNDLVRCQRLITQTATRKPDASRSTEEGVKRLVAAWIRHADTRSDADSGTGSVGDKPDNAKVYRYPAYGSKCR